MAPDATRAHYATRAHHATTMSAHAWFTALVVAVAVERLAELRVARRNRRWSLARGGVEYGARHYPVLVVLHAGLLAGSLAEVWLRRPPFVPALGWTMLALVLAAQSLRWWCIHSLGPHWNTRIIIVPGTTLTRRGPYRWFPHPNYVAVVVEGAALPLVGSAWITALCFTVANLAVLAVRIRTENRALATLRAG